MSDDIWEDDDLDFMFDDDDSSGGRGSKDSKKAIAKEALIGTASGLAAGTKATVTSILPKGAGAAGELFEVKDNLANITDEMSKTGTKTLNSFKKSSEKLLPKARNFLPKSLYKKIETFSSSYDREPEQEQRASEEEIREENIANKLNSLFGKKAKQDSELLIENKVETMVDRNINISLHKDNMSALSAISGSLRNLEDFSNTQTLNYMRESLKLKYRHVYIAKDTLKAVKVLTALSETNLRDIVHNTGLPDVQKKRLLENLKEAKLATVSSAVNAKAGKYVGDLFGKLKNDIFAPITEIAGGLADAGEGLVEMSEMDDSMAEFEERGENTILAGAATKSLGGLIGKSFVGKQLKKYLNAGSLDESLGNLKTKALLNLDELRNQGGILGTIARSAPGLSIDGNSLETKVEDADGGVRLATVEIIPGLLSRILRETEAIRTGNVGELQAYDAKKGTFVDISERKETVKKEIFGTVSNRTNRTVEVLSSMRGSMEHLKGEGNEDLESFDDLAVEMSKTVNNMAYEQLLLRPVRFAEYIDDPTKTSGYIDKVFKGVSQPVEVASLILKSVTKEDGSIYAEGVKVFNNKLINLMNDSKYNEFINKMWKSASSEITKDFRDKRGNISKDYVMESLNDVDAEELKQNISMSSDRHRRNYKKTDENISVLKKDFSKIKDTVNAGVDKSLALKDSIIKRYKEDTLEDDLTNLIMDVYKDTSVKMSDKISIAKTRALDMAKEKYPDQYEYVKDSIDEIVFDPKIYLDKAKDTTKSLVDKSKSLATVGKNKLQKVGDYALEHMSDDQRDLMDKAVGKFDDSKTLIKNKYNEAKSLTQEDVIAKAKELKQSADEKLIKGKKLAEEKLEESKKYALIKYNAGKDLVKQEAPLDVSKEITPFIKESVKQSEKLTDSIKMLSDGYNDFTTHLKAKEETSTLFIDDMRTLLSEEDNPLLSGITDISESVKPITTQLTSIIDLLNNPSNFNNGTVRTTSDVNSIIEAPDKGDEKGMITFKEIIEASKYPKKMKSLLGKTGSLVKAGGKGYIDLYGKLLSAAASGSGKLLEGGGSLLSGGGTLIGKMGEAGKNVIPGAINAYGNLLSSTIGTTISASTTAASKLTGFMFSKGEKETFINIYVKDDIDPGKPLLSKRQQQKGVFFEDGDQVKASDEITEPVFDKDGECIITQEDIDAGIVDVDNKPLGSGKLGFGKTRMGNVLSKGFGGLKDIGSLLAGKALPAYYKGIFGMGTAAVKGGSNILSSIFGNLTGSKGGGSSDPDDLENIIGTRLDSILDILDTRTKDILSSMKGPEPLFGDTDGDGDVEGSYKDRISKKKLSDSVKDKINAKQGETQDKEKKPKSSLMKKAGIWSAAAGAGGYLASQAAGYLGLGETGQDVAGMAGGAAGLAATTSTGRSLAMKGVKTVGKQAAKWGGRALAMGGTGLISGAGTAAAATGSAIAGGASALAGGIATGVGAIAASPVLLGALGVAAVGAIGYGLYKHFTKDKDVKAGNDLAVLMKDKGMFHDGWGWADWNLTDEGKEAVKMDFSKRELEALVKSEKIDDEAKEYIQYILDDWTTIEAIRKKADPDRKLKGKSDEISKEFNEEHPENEKTFGEKFKSAAKITLMANPIGAAYGLYKYLTKDEDIKYANDLARKMRDNGLVHDGWGWAGWNLTEEGKDAIKNDFTEEELKILVKSDQLDEEAISFIQEQLDNWTEVVAGREKNNPTGNVKVTDIRESLKEEKDEAEEKKKDLLSYKKVMATAAMPAILPLALTRGLFDYLNREDDPEVKKANAFVELMLKEGLIKNPLGWGDWKLTERGKEAISMHFKKEELTLLLKSDKLSDEDKEYISNRLDNWKLLEKSRSMTSTSVDESAATERVRSEMDGEYGLDAFASEDKAPKSNLLTLPNIADVTGADRTKRSLVVPDINDNLAQYREEQSYKDKLLETSVTGNNISVDNTSLIAAIKEQTMVMAGHLGHIGENTKSAIDKEFKVDVLVPQGGSAAPEIAVTESSKFSGKEDVKKMSLSTMKEKSRTQVFS